jgi:hypothetical protein
LEDAIEFYKQALERIDNFSKDPKNQAINELERLMNVEQAENFKKIRVLFEDPDKAKAHLVLNP